MKDYLLTPIYQPSDVGPDSSTSSTQYYYHNSLSEPKTITPAQVSQADHHLHTSLSFYSQDPLFDHVSDSLPIETPTPSGSGDYLDDVEEFTARIYQKLNRFLFLNDEPMLRIPNLYPSDDIFVRPPTSANSSQGIRFPRSLSQSNYSFLYSNKDSTENDANSLSESTLSDGSVSPPVPSFEAGHVGTVKLSDSVLANVNTPPPTHVHPLTLPPRDNKEASLSRQEESWEQHQSVGEYQSTITKTVEQTNFERGQIDYTGLDSFSSIQAHIDKMLN